MKRWSLLLTPLVFLCVYSAAEDALPCPVPWARTLLVFCVRGEYTVGLVRWKPALVPCLRALARAARQLRVRVPRVRLQALLRSRDPRVYPAARDEDPLAVC